MMGCHAKITATEFPKQGGYLGRRAEVCFHYGSGGYIGGVVVRDDYEDPFQTIIRLDDGRYVTAGECQYRPVTDPQEARRT